MSTSLAASVATVVVFSGTEMAGLIGEVITGLSSAPLMVTVSTAVSVAPAKSDIV